MCSAAMTLSLHVAQCWPRTSVKLQLGALHSKMTSSTLPFKFELAFRTGEALAHCAFSEEGHFFSQRLQSCCEVSMNACGDDEIPELDLADIEAQLQDLEEVATHSSLSCVCTSIHERTEERESILVSVSCTPWATV